MICYRSLNSFAGWISTRASEVVLVIECFPCLPFPIILDLSGRWHARQGYSPCDSRFLSLLPIVSSFMQQDLSLWLSLRTWGPWMHRDFLWPNASVQVTSYSEVWHSRVLPLKEPLVALWYQGWLRVTSSGKPSLKFKINLGVLPMWFHSMWFP